MKKSFEEWMARVDRAVQELTGLSSSDLADYRYRDAYDAGETPTMTARRAIAADQGEEDCDEDED